MNAHPNQITKLVIGAAIEVHRALGPGLLESAYQNCLARELAVQAIPFQKKVGLALEYKGIRIEQAYRVDFLVAGSVAVELKAVVALTPLV